MLLLNTNTWYKATPPKKRLSTSSNTVCALIFVDVKSQFDYISQKALQGRARCSFLKKNVFVFWWGTCRFLAELEVLYSNDGIFFREPDLLVQLAKKSHLLRL